GGRGERSPGAPGPQGCSRGIRWRCAQAQVVGRLLRRSAASWLWCRWPRPTHRCAQWPLSRLSSMFALTFPCAGTSTMDPEEGSRERRWAMGVDYDVDLAVIGSGGAAMSAAIAASQAGKSVVLVERGVLGGTCVNIGCVPSTALLAAAVARHDALTNPFKGAPTSAAPVNLGDLVGQEDALIERLRDAKYADVAAAYGFQVRPGQASFLDGDTLAVD